MQFDLVLIGNGKMITHNGRLANPLDPYTRKLKELTSKRNKTDEDLVEIARVEARGGLYETADNLVGIDPECIIASLRASAKKWKLGKALSVSLFPESPDIIPLTIGGRTWDADEYVSTLDNIDMRPVRVGMSKVLRSRPVMDKWTCRLRVVLLTEEVDIDEFPRILDRAGQYIGLCEWRPRFGRYTWAIENESMED